MRRGTRPACRHNAGMSDQDPNDGGAPEPPVSVPHHEISAPALRGLVESFVLREGTDYGEHEVSLDDKVRQVMRQLERGEAEVMYDPNTNSVSVVVASGRRPRG